MTRDLPGKAQTILAFLWCLTIVLVPLRIAQSLKEIVIGLTPFVILGAYGWKWIRVYLQQFMFFALVIFLVLTAIPQLFNGSLYYGLDSIRFFHLKLIAIVFSLIFLCRDQNTQDWLLWSFVGALIFLVFFGYYDYFLPNTWQLWEKSGAMVSSWPEAVSPFGYHKNSYGQFFVFTIPVVIGLAFYNLERSSPSLSIPLSLGSLCCLAVPVLIFSKSRSAQIGVIVGSLIVILLYGLKKRRLIVLLFLLLIVLGIIVAYFTPIGVKSLERWQIANVSQTLESRYRIWRDVYDVAKKRWLFGINFSGESYNKYFLSKSGIRNHEHNIFLYYFTRSGLFGLVGYLIFCFSLIAFGCWFLLKRANMRQYCLVSGLMAAFFADTFVRGLVTKYPNHFYFSVLIGLFIAIGSVNERVVNSSER